MLDPSIIIYLHIFLSICIYLPLSWYVKVSTCLHEISQQHGGNQET